MRKFKIIDNFIQVVLIGLALLCAPLASRWGREEEFFIWYFVVGGWQILSVIVHFIMYEPPHKSLLRRIYLITLLLVIIVLLVSVTSFVIEALFGLLCFSPVMAIYYLVTCIIETRRLPDTTAATVQEHS